jgi:hypothetical protein
MCLRLRSLTKLAVSLSMLLLLLGCLSPAPPDEDDGGQGSGQGGDGTPVADWDTLMAQLPDASFEHYGLYMEAVLDALRAVYAEDPHIVVYSEPPQDDEAYGELRYTCVWRRFLGEPPAMFDHQDSAAYAQVEFWARPAEGKAPCLADIVRGDEYMGWSSDEDVGATREAVMRMWQALLDGYSAVESPFWEAFTALHQVGATGHLTGAGGEFLLPGPEGYDSSLVFRANGDQEGCSVVALVSFVPEGGFPSDPEDWGTLASALPQPGFGTSLPSYAESMVAALRRASADRDVIIAQTGMASPANAEKRWEQETFTWLRFPGAAGDPGYLLETLTLRLTPGPADAPGPLATAMTITELVAWNPESYGTPQSFQALIPARDLFLESYLSIGDDFLEALKGLELTPGLLQELPGPDGSKVQLTVEEVAQEDAALRVRYTLTCTASSGE